MATSPHSSGLTRRRSAGPHLRDSFFDHPPPFAALLRGPLFFRRQLGAPAANHQQLSPVGVAGVGLRFADGDAEVLLARGACLRRPGLRTFASSSATSVCCLAARRYSRKSARGVLVADGADGCRLAARRLVRNAASRTLLRRPAGSAARHTASAACSERALSSSRSQPSADRVRDLKRSPSRLSGVGLAGSRVLRFERDARLSATTRACLQHPGSWPARRSAAAALCHVLAVSASTPKPPASRSDLFNLMQWTLGAPPTATCSILASYVSRSKAKTATVQRLADTLRRAGIVTATWPLSPISNLPSRSPAHVLRKAVLFGWRAARSVCWLVADQSSPRSTRSEP